MAAYMQWPFSRDRARMITASGTGVSGSARVSDSATGAEIRRLEDEGDVTAIAFSPDGTRVATASADGYARIWITEPRKLIEQAESRVTRNLTEQEWRRYFGSEPCRKTRAHLPVPTKSGPSRAERLAGSWLRALPS